MSYPIYQRIACALNDAHCKAQHKVTKKVHKKVHKNVHHVTHALAYHLETLYVSVFALLMAVAFL